MSSGGNECGGSSNRETHDSDLDGHCQGVGSAESKASGGGVDSSMCSGDEGPVQGDGNGTGGDYEGNVNYQCIIDDGRVVDSWTNFTVFLRKVAEPDPV